MALKTRFNEAKADHVVSFFEKLLVHTKGSYARQPFLLSPFQRDEIIRPLFGTQMFDPELDEWVRLYNAAWLEMGRKNGKSEVLAGVALYMTGADDEEGAEVYGVAKDTDQATHVFRVARRMVELSPTLSRHFKIYPTNKRITYPKTDSFYRVIAADAMGNLGQNPHGILVDEVIAQPDGELWSALKTGFGTRRQPLMVGATTAGPATAEFARTEHDFSLRVAANPDLDPRRYVFIRNLPKDADWRDEKLWSQPNPALGSFLRPQVLRDELQVALNHPREERDFRMYRLNQWQPGGVDGWDAADCWPDQGNAGLVPEAKLKGKPAWGGMAALSATDLCAIAWTFDNPEGSGLWTLWRYFLPEDRLPDLRGRTGGDADAWVKSGHLTLTDGDEIDIPRITAQIRADAAVFDVRQFSFVKSGAIGIMQPIIAERLFKDDAVTAVSMGGGGASLVDWEAMLRRGEYNHGANPITAWSVAHVVVKQTTTGTQISQMNSSENVYGVIAAELALRRYIVTRHAKSKTLHGASF